MLAWWKERSTKLLDRHYEEATEERRLSLEKTELIGVFFGSFYNRPSRLLCQFLKEFYEEIRSEYGPQLDLIYLPMDENEKDCSAFVRSMHGDWLVVPWKNQAVRRNVRNMYNVITIPAVVIIKNTPSAPIVTQEGKIDIQEFWTDAFPKWTEAAKTL